MKNDRREIAPLLLPYFPSMEGATSDEWHGFLNAQTGLDVDLEEMNATAFDKWRIALANAGLPVWDYTPERIENMRKRGEELRDMEQKRRDDMGKTLADLAKEAPNMPAEALIEAAKKARKR